MIKIRLSDTYETIDTGNPVQALELLGSQTPSYLARSNDARLFRLRTVSEFPQLELHGPNTDLCCVGESAAKYKEYMTTLVRAVDFEKPY